MAVTATISSLNPTSGTVGTHVQINGMNFVQGGLHGVVVFASGVQATTVFSYSNTQIIVAVPAGAVTGNVFVEFPAGNSNTKPFTITTPPTPTITSLTPSNGGIGIAVTIGGTNFGSVQNSSTVTFNGIPATVTSWSATAIVATVPAMATTGPVIVTVASIASNSMTFTVTNPSNGGTGAPLNLLLIPCQQFNTQVVLAFDTTNFNDLSNQSFYFYKVEEVAQGRTPSCTRQVITYRDLGVATLKATLVGYNQNTSDPNNQVVSGFEIFTIGSAAATGRLCTIVRGLTLTAQNLQYQLTRDAAAGPVSIVKVRLEGEVELTEYA